jgi:hypothetical protein
MAHDAAVHGAHAVENPDRFLYGLMAEFDDPDALLAAARRTKQEGYLKVEGYAPFPLEGLDEALGHHDMKVPWAMLGAGIMGAIGGFGFLAYFMGVDYPLNIGGKPLFSWPMYIPITFEMTVLSAALTGIVGMFWMNGLPSPYHPVFNEPDFERATSDRFFLCIEATDGMFDRKSTREFMDTLGAIKVSEVELEK